MRINVFILFSALFLVVLMSCKPEKEIDPPLPPNEPEVPTPPSEPDPLLPGETDGFILEDGPAGILALEDFLRSDQAKRRVNLLDKPLQEIQSTIIGKWKIAICYGGVVGISYPIDGYITIDEKTLDASGSNVFFGRTTFEYEWRLLETYEGYERYVLCNKLRKTDKVPGIQLLIGGVFRSLICNDILVMESYTGPFIDMLVRVRE